MGARVYLEVPITGPPFAGRSALTGAPKEGRRAAGDWCRDVRDGQDAMLPPTTGAESSLATCTGEAVANGAVCSLRASCGLVSLRAPSAAEPSRLQFTMVFLDDEEAGMKPVSGEGCGARALGQSSWWKLPLCNSLLLLPAAPLAEDAAEEEGGGGKIRGTFFSATLASTSRGDSFGEA